MAAWSPPTARQIAQGLGLRPSGTLYIGRCPACSYGGAFTVADRGGTTLIRCHVGCDQRDVIDALRRTGLWAGVRDGVTPRPAKAARNATADGSSATELAVALWDRAALAGFATLATSDVLERYLARRGFIGPIPRSLRFLPQARHTPTHSQWPTMLAAVTREPTGAIVAVHRTFLRSDGTGKAPVEPAKMSLGPIGGGAVRLAEAGERLAVVEGIETGLSVLAATGVPTWAALSAGGLRRLMLPPLPLAAEVTVCADHDPVGIAAAHDAAERWRHQGRRVRLALPPVPGSDFNDLARAGGGAP